MRHLALFFLVLTASCAVDHATAESVDEAVAPTPLSITRVFYPRILFNQGTWQETTVQLSLGDNEEDRFTVQVPAIITRTNVAGNAAWVEIPRVAGERLVRLSYQAMGDFQRHSLVQAKIIHAPSSMAIFTPEFIISSLDDAGRGNAAWSTVHMPTFRPAHITEASHLFLLFNALQAEYIVGQIAATYESLPDAFQFN